MGHCCSSAWPESRGFLSASISRDGDEALMNVKLRSSNSPLEECWQSLVLTSQVASLTKQSETSPSRGDLYLSAMWRIVGCDGRKGGGWEIEQYNKVTNGINEGEYDGKLEGKHSEDNEMDWEADGRLFRLCTQNMTVWQGKGGVINTGLLPQWCHVCLHTGKVNLKVSAEALKTETLCGNEVATVPDVGQIDTVIRTLLVEVSDIKNTADCYSGPELSSKLCFFAFWEVWEVWDLISISSHLYLTAWLCWESSSKPHSTKQSQHQL